MGEADEHSLFHIPNYYCISQPKQCSSHAGLIIYVHRKFQYQVLNIFNKSEIWEGLAICIYQKHTNKNKVPANIYKPPKENNNINIETFVNELNPSIQNLNNMNANLVITGDFNINFLDINSRQTYKDFYETMITNGLCPSITLPTRFTCTLIDNIFHNCIDNNKLIKSGALLTDLSDHLPYIWCKIDPPFHASFLICCFYRSPSVSLSESMELFLNNLDTVTGSKLEYIVIGDLNINCLEDTFNNRNEIQYLCDLFNISQLVKEPTRVTTTSKTLIDVILTSMPENHQNTSVIKITLSDHFMICTDIVYEKSFEPKEINVRSFVKFHENSYLNDLTAVINSINLQANLCYLWDQFKTNFIHVCNKHAPMRTYRIKGNAQPWVNHDIVCEMRHRDELHERATKLNDDNLFNEYRKTRNRVTQKIRNNKKKFYTDQIINRNICNSSNQELWKSVRSLLGNGKSTMDCLKILLVVT